MAHLGENIARIRGMRRMTQKEVAGKIMIGQSDYSRIEQKAQIEDDLLEKIAKALEVSSDMIREFREEAIFTNNVYEQNNSISQIYFQTNPIDKIVELYERMLKEKDELINHLKQGGL
jgi:transcriptional regulator with XRE-family HTH domain